MTTTSGIFGALALFVFTFLAFEMGSIKTHDDGKDEPIGHVMYDETDRR